MKTVSFEEQIMSKDKFTSIFSRQMEAIVFITLQIFYNTREKVFTNSLLFAAWNIYFLSFLSYAFIRKQMFPFFCNNHITLSHLELNIRSWRQAWKSGNITRVISSDIPQF